MSIWTSIPEGAQPIAAATGLPGDEPLSVEVAIAPSWNNRTRISAWNGETGIEILVDPDSLEELIGRLQLALVAEQGAACSALPPETVRIVNEHGATVRELKVPHGNGLHVVEIDPPLVVDPADTIRIVTDPPPIPNGDTVLAVDAWCSEQGITFHPDTTPLTTADVARIYDVPQELLQRGAHRVEAP